MIRRRRSLVLLTFALALAVGAATAPSEVDACRLVRPEPEDRLTLFAETSTAAVVGEVVHEEDDSVGDQSAFTSTFQVVAVLSGDPPDELVLDDLGFLGADCSGGPRLQAGDRFLLFLTTEQPSPRGGDSPAGEWRVAHAGQASYLLQDGTVSFYEGRYEPPGTEAVGPAEDFIRKVGDALRSDAEEVDRAIAYVDGDVAPHRVTPLVDEGLVDDGVASPVDEGVEPPPLEGDANPMAVGGSVAIAMIATGIIVGWLLRARSRRSGRRGGGEPEA